MEILKRTRKSGFEDAFFVIAIVFAVVIFILVLSKAWGEMKTPLADSIQGTLPAGSGVNITNNFSAVTSTINLFDKLLPFLLIGLFAFVLIGASLYMNHPIMIIVGIIILAIAIMLAVIYANIYHQISQTDEFASTTSQFPISDKFMEYLPLVIILIFVGVTIAIIWSRGGGGNL